MRHDLEKYLVKKFPLCFGDYGKDMKQTCMCWGLDCNRGWYKIIKEVCQKCELLIQKWIEDNKMEPHIYIYRWFPSWFPEIISKPTTKVFLKFIFKFFPKFAIKITAKHIKDWAPRFSQVKEKYGTLSIYWTNATDEMYAISDEAETKSETTCESCGKIGKIRGKFWYYTSCYKCAKLEDRENLEIVEDAYEKKEKSNG
jgi:hypothetical protein